MQVFQFLKSDIFKRTLHLSRFYPKKNPNRCEAFGVNWNRLRTTFSRDWVFVAVAAVVFAVGEFCLAVEDLDFGLAFYLALRRFEFGVSWAVAWIYP